MFCRRMKGTISLKPPSKPDRVLVKVFHVRNTYAVFGRTDFTVLKEISYTRISF